MILYVVNKAFPQRTFVVSVKPHQKVARIRAQLLHTLFDLGKDDHQFRLRYKGQILRDAYSFADYEIMDNAVISMLPAGKSQEILMEIRSIASSEFTLDPATGQPPDVKAALEKEVKTFDRRERMVDGFKVLLCVHFIAAFLSLMTVHWYSVFWLGLIWAVGIYFVPTYSRLGGFIGNTSHLKLQFCIGSLIVCVAVLAVSLYFCISGWIFITSGDCGNWQEEGSCSYQKVYTSIFFTLHVVLLTLTIALVSVLLSNFKIEVGDCIEKYLVQERDVDQVMQMAKDGKAKEKRVAAYDLAAMAASSDDNKFRIVAEGGLEVLTALALSRDEETQEHAVEALAEILTIPTIQDTFVETGGVRTLTAVLHSPRPRVLQEAALALYSIVADSEDNKHAIIEDHGLEDLSHAAFQGTIYCQRIIASIFLELAFHAEIRRELASRNSPAQALVHLCKSNDPDTQRFALQSLEVLAIESTELICAQENLLCLLLELPICSMDVKLCLLAGKILLYFAENPETCQQLLNHPQVRTSLELFAQTADPVLQKVVVKVIFCSLDQPHLQVQARSLGLSHVLEYIKNFAANRETWEMADQCLEDFNMAMDLSGLPSLSTLEKLSKMEAKGNSPSGSRSSLSTEDRNSSDSYSSDMKKAKQ